MSKPYYVTARDTATSPSTSFASSCSQSQTLSICSWVNEVL